ncbi:Os08g0352400, partial [Oryza sativa Japonica Group]
IGDDAQHGRNAVGVFSGELTAPLSLLSPPVELQSGRDLQFVLSVRQGWLFPLLGRGSRGGSRQRGFYGGFCGGR